MERKEIKRGVEYAISKRKRARDAERGMCLDVMDRAEFDRMTPAEKSERWPGGTFWGWQYANGPVAVFRKQEVDTGAYSTRVPYGKTLPEFVNVYCSSRHVLVEWDVHNVRRLEQIKKAQETNERYALAKMEREGNVAALRESIGVGESFGRMNGTRGILLSHDEIKELVAAIAEIEWGNEEGE